MKIICRKRDLSDDYFPINNRDTHWCCDDLGTLSEYGGRQMALKVINMERHGAESPPEIALVSECSLAEPATELHYVIGYCPFCGDSLEIG